MVKANDYLKQLMKCDAIIENKLSEKEYYKRIASGITSNPGGERVQASGSKQRMADAVAKWVDIDREIDKCIDDQITLRTEIVGVIQQLKSAVEYDILHKMYVGVMTEKPDETIAVERLTFQQIADLYGKTYSWATTVHGRALQNVQKILDAM